MCEWGEVKLDEIAEVKCARYLFDKIKTLENLRDTLLPKLMSGEVRVI